MQKKESETEVQAHLDCKCSQDNRLEDWASRDRWGNLLRDEPGTVCSDQLMKSPLHQHEGLEFILWQ